jgi:hypothetical protein
MCVALQGGAFSHENAALCDGCPQLSHRIASSNWSRNISLFIATLHTSRSYWRSTAGLYGSLKLTKTFLDIGWDLSFFLKGMSALSTVWIHASSLTTNATLKRVTFLVRPAQKTVTYPTVSPVLLHQLFRSSPWSNFIQIKSEMDCFTGRNMTDKLPFSTWSILTLVIETKREDFFDVPFSRQCRRL